MKSSVPRRPSSINEPDHSHCDNDRPAGFAENVIFARKAALLGVDFNSLETKVEAQWDRKGMFGIRDADPAITHMLIETRITTEAPQSRVVELVRLTGSRCPMTATQAKAATIRQKLFVNGEEVQA